MKPEFDREIEALLRGGAGRARGDFARAPARDSSHMDADELSAYAENALPPATRARYTAHLADCDACRHIVTGVALASGAAPVLEKRAGLLASEAVAASPRETRAEARPSGWLAALFSPRALRWAVPLLAIALTGVVAYVALRSRNEAGLVAGISERNAQRQEAVTSNSAPQSPSSTTNTTNATTATDAPATLANANTNTNAGGEAPADATNAPQSADARKLAAASNPAQELAKQEQAGAGATTFDGLSASQSPAPPPAEGPVLADVSKSAPAADEVVTTTAAPPAPKSRADEDRVGAISEEARRAEKKEQDSFGRNVSRRGADDEAPGGANIEKRKPRAQPPAAGARSQRESGSDRDSGDFSSRNRARGRSSEAEDAPAERRTVAGHEFRRQDGAWVDVRYNNSMRTRDIGRGTESYRTLAADFPEVQSITARLSGTVLVVLGGRAYRIN